MRLTKLDAALTQEQLAKLSRFQFTSQICKFNKTVIDPITAPREFTLFILFWSQAARKKRHRHPQMSDIITQVITHPPHPGL